jgi:hypothetical protein
MRCQIGTGGERRRDLLALHHANMTQNVSSIFPLGK